MNIETDSRNTESAKTFYGVSKESDHEEYASYFKPGISPEGNRKTASPSDSELETQYMNHLAPKQESLNVYEDTQDERSNSIMIIVFVLTIFIGVFYLSKKYIIVDHTELEVPVAITTEEPSEKLSEEKKEME